MLRPGDLVLLDLWAGRSLDTVFADQTWIGFAGEPAAGPGRARYGGRCGGARDAAIAVVREAAAAGRPIAGFEADRAARAVIEAAGYGRSPSCTGPATRSIGTCTARAPTWTTTRPTTTGGCCRGLGFSVEPGIYLAGEFGVRSEVNVYLGPAGPEVTPREPQQELIVAD